jgi:hypothetical protein
MNEFILTEGKKERWGMSEYYERVIKAMKDDSKD